MVWILYSPFVIPLTGLDGRALDDNFHDVYQPFSLTLASADYLGRVYIWQLHKVRHPNHYYLW